MIWEEDIEKLVQADKIIAKELKSYTYISDRELVNN